MNINKKLFVQNVQQKRRHEDIFNVQCFSYNKKNTQFQIEKTCVYI